MMIKAKVNIGGTIYYTKSQTINPGERWQMSTSAADYDYLVYNNAATSAATSFTREQLFPIDLVVTDDSPVNIVIMQEKNTAKVEYAPFDQNSTAADQDNIGWISAEDVVSAVLPYLPARKIQFPVTAVKSGSPDLTNAVTLYLDASGKLLGASCLKPVTNDAFNSNFPISGSVSNVQYSGNKADFDLKFADGDYQDQTATKYYEISGSYDCGASGTTGSFSDLTVNCVGLTANYQSSGYTISTSGSGVTSSSLVN